MTFFNKIKTFINDHDGLTVVEISIILTLGLFVFVGIKYAFAQDLSNNQIHFFEILSYPVLAAIAKQAIEKFGFPNIRKNNSNYTNEYQNYSNYNDNYYNNLSNNEIIENVNNKPTI